MSTPVMWAITQTQSAFCTENRLFYDKDKEHWLRWFQAVPTLFHHREMALITKRELRRRGVNCEVVRVSWVVYPEPVGD